MRHSLVSIAIPTALMALLAAATVGCTGAKYPIVPVEGKLLFADGKPLPAGTLLVFNPAEGETRIATAVTTEDGSFKVTHVSGANGAELGKYAILLRAPEGDTEAFYKMIPRDYYDGGVLHAEVKEGMAPLDLKVKRK